MFLLELKEHAMRISEIFFTISVSPLNAEILDLKKVK
jgi:hypothetical protein